jgi:hypothetical protein
MQIYPVVHRTRVGENQFVAVDPRRHPHAMAHAAMRHARPRGARKKCAARVARGMLGATKFSTGNFWDSDVFLYVHVLFFG